MHTVDDENVKKVVQAVKAGPTNNLAYESAMELAIKWLVENDDVTLYLTAEQKKAIQEVVSH
ncbi:hypothetical protein ACNPE2_26940 [Klebsiella pneumoniae]|uniref:hypothetical protein n=1 Tax=Klebsiella pneumoniae TaxID=573 RepID=UPI00211C2893|nr:hypothetical protein [Klebsiella pneumoniae]MDX4082026.1 hypothetical protein [Klebsiella pneumoniae]MDX4129908.1 hypothetical protein [Klebsiella pneumoniae]MEA4337417.1 hypothetical protein [Klebsiella pneumoniae]HBQ9366653.1 hypothetical protein [Klebsiella pneumoniae]HBT5538590.1 hypothetical protein [Klebsiella pneumoniae]